MQNRIIMKLNSILPIALFTLIAAGFTSCSDDDTVLQELNSPSVSTTLQTFNSLTFEWDKVENAVQYGYQLLDPSGNVVSTGTTTATTATLTDLQYATTYTLNVWAFAAMNSDFTTAPTVTLTATTAPLTKLATPTVSLATSGSTNTFSWEAVDHAESYTYEVSLDGEVIRTASITSTSIAIRGLEKGDYKFHVKATTTEEGFENGDYSEGIDFSVERMIAWQVTGTYYSYSLNKSWDAVMVAYDDGSYTIQAWYGVEGYNLDFSINKSDADGSFQVLNGTYDDNTWLYGVPTGLSDYPEVNIYRWYEYSYMDGNSTSGIVNINHLWGEYYVNDTFTWEAAKLNIDDLVGTYNNTISYSSYDDSTGDWAYYSYNDWVATIEKVDNTTITIDGLLWTDCPLTANVDLNNRTITFPIQDYAGWYTFALNDWTNFEPTSPVIGTINGDGTIELSGFCYWYYNGSWWTQYLDSANAKLTKN